jgi:hypothetical protein
MHKFLTSTLGTSEKIDLAWNRGCFMPGETASNVFLAAEYSPQTARAQWKRKMFLAENRTSILFMYFVTRSLH